MGGSRQFDMHVYDEIHVQLIIHAPYMIWDKELTQLDFSVRTVDPAADLSFLREVILNKCDQPHGPGQFNKLTLSYTQLHCPAR